MKKKKGLLNVEIRFGKYLMTISKKGFSIWFKNRWFIDASTLFDDGELKINKEHKELPHFKKFTGHREHYSFRMEKELLKDTRRSN